MASRKLADLVPSVCDKAGRFLAACEEAGIDLLVTCTYRSDEEQAALFAQGRNSLAVVNDLRQKAGIAPISEEENQRKVTNARPGQSLHAKRVALDVVPIVAGKPLWNAEPSEWETIGRIGESCGLEWAGRWTSFKELAHFECRPEPKENQNDRD